MKKTREKKENVIKTFSIVSIMMKFEKPKSRLLSKSHKNENLVLKVKLSKLCFIKSFVQKTIAQAHTLKSLLTSDVNFVSQQAPDQTVLMEVDGK